MRTALVDDAPAIARVQVEGWRAAYRGMIPDSLLDSMSIDERTTRWKKNLANPIGTALVTEEEGQVVGWTGFGRSRDEGTPQDCGEIYGFYVSPSKWRTGVGSAMWRETCGQLARAGFVTAELWVLEANDRARRFYEAMGCIPAAGAIKMFEIEGHAIPEVKYSISLDQFRRT